MATTSLRGAAPRSALASPRRPAVHDRRCPHDAPRSLEPARRHRAPRRPRHRGAREDGAATRRALTLASTTVHRRSLKSRHARGRSRRSAAARAGVDRRLDAARRCVVARSWAPPQLDAGRAEPSAIAAARPRETTSTPALLETNACLFVFLPRSLPRAASAPDGLAALRGPRRCAPRSSRRRTTSTSRDRGIAPACGARASATSLRVRTCTRRSAPRAGVARARRSPSTASAMSNACWRFTSVRRRTAANRREASTGIRRRTRARENNGASLSHRTRSASSRAERCCKTATSRVRAGVRR